jgi:glycosyltransferase involved in cell wall biosynthesis
VAKASLILCASKQMADDLKKRYKNKRIEVAYIGYEENVFSKITTKISMKSNRKIKIAHFGSINFSRKRDISPLLEAISSLKKKNEINHDNFELSFIGHSTNFEKTSIIKYNLEDIVIFYNYMEKSVGLKKINEEYDYLLMYGTPNQVSEITSKLFEYLRLNKPILGICKGNEAEMIIKDTGTGEVCGFDSEEIEFLIKKAVNKTIFFEPKSMEIKKYDSLVQTQNIFSYIKDSITK